MYINKKNVAQKNLMKFQKENSKERTENDPVLIPGVSQMGEKNRS